MNDMRKLMDTLQQINEAAPRRRRLTKAAPPKKQPATKNKNLIKAIKRGVQNIWDEGFDTEDAVYDIRDAVLNSIGIIPGRIKDEKLIGAIERGVQNIWDEGFDTEDAVYEISDAIIRSVRKAGY